MCIIFWGVVVVVVGTLLTITSAANSRTHPKVALFADFVACSSIVRTPGRNKIGGGLPPKFPAAGKIFTFYATA